MFSQHLREALKAVPPPKQERPTLNLPKIPLNEPTLHRSIDQVVRSIGRCRAVLLRMEPEDRIELVELLPREIHASAVWKEPLVEVLAGICCCKMIVTTTQEPPPRRPGCQEPRYSRHRVMIEGRSSDIQILSSAALFVLKSIEQISRKRAAEQKRLGLQITDRWTDVYRYKAAASGRTVKAIIRATKRFGDGS